MPKNSLLNTRLPIEVFAPRQESACANFYYSSEDFWNFKIAPPKLKQEWGGSHNALVVMGAFFTIECHSIVIYSYPLVDRNQI